MSHKRQKMTGNQSTSRNLQDNSTKISIGKRKRKIARPLTDYEKLKKDVKTVKEKVNSSAFKPSKMILRSVASGKLSNVATGVIKMNTVTLHTFGAAKRNLGVTSMQFWDAGTSTYKDSVQTDNNVDVVNITYHTHKLTLKNKEHSANVRVYLLQPRNNTDETPGDAITSGFTKGVVDYDSNYQYNPSMYPSDSPDFKHLYKVISSHTEHLSPGELAVFKSRGNANKGYEYKTEGVSGENYSKNDLFWLVQYYNDIANDQTTKTDVSWGPCDMNYMEESTIVYSYNAGGPPKTSIKLGYSEDMTDAFTVGPETVEKHDAVTTAH